MFGRKSRRRLLRENVALRSALLWYAAEETWRRKGIHQKGAPRKKWQKSPAAYDRGHVALRTLSKVDEPARLIFDITVPALAASTKTSSTLGDSEPTHTDTD